ncbi:DsrE family protein [Metallumcola ferriviriculae]|uniref:DsrE family protein n=1 Tax=Metallumcola ferriviriculae TaxID=3039180 RepID=A0AAU0UNA9_9FIRM|nr:DsrE family protein [Desulfitibacteraceae bacterium MK1]
MTNKLLVTVTVGENDPEKATVAFNMAATAVVSGMEVIVACSAEGVELGINNGAAEGITVDKMPPLVELMDTFFEGGGKMIVCTPCFAKRGYQEQDLREGAILAGAAKVVEFLSEGAATMSF